MRNRSLSLWSILSLLLRWLNAKQIWDTLKISHEGNDATMITKMELVEGELGRFAMKRGEKPTKTYNRLKTLVNKI